MERCPTRPVSVPIRAVGVPSRRRALALMAGVLCITACEYSQLVFVTPSAVKALGIGGEAYLAQHTGPTRLAGVATLVAA